MTDSHKITLEEFVGIFGDDAPMEAYALLLSAPGKMTIGEVRARLHKMAGTRAALAAAPQPAPEWEICEVCRGTGIAGHPDSGNTCYLCDGSGAVDPQPAVTDRQALVGAIRAARCEWANDGDSESCPDQAIADALLARGLRLPAPETEPRRCAECTCEGGEHECNWIKPGPIRVVEGGDDAA